MRTVIMRALLITVGATGTYYPSMAQSTAKAEDVLREALPALALNDQSALAKLTKDQAEFKKFVWPTTAARMSETGADNTTRPIRK